MASLQVTVKIMKIVYLHLFRAHRLVKVKQDQTFNKLHDLKDPSQLLLQFDFSENAEVTEQDEVQSGHWWHLQVRNFYTFIT